MGVSLRRRCHLNQLIQTSGGSVPTGDTREKENTALTDQRTGQTGQNLIFNNSLLRQIQMQTFLVVTFSPLSSSVTPHLSLYAVYALTEIVCLLAGLQVHGHFPPGYSLHVKLMV